MRVTFLLPYADLSGGVRVVSIHARKLLERGHQVQVVSFFQKAPSLKDRLKALFTRTNLEILEKQGPSHLDTSEVPWRILKSPAALEDCTLPEADLLVTTWWETVEWTRGLSLSRGIPVHFVQAYEVFGGPEEKIHEILSMPTFKITVSRWLKDLLEKKFGHDPDRIALVPNTVDTEFFQAPPRGKQAVPRVGVIYTTTHNKGCDLAIDAFEKARRTEPRLQLVSFGKIPKPELPRGASYFVSPPQEKIPSIYASCDAWIFSGRNEGFGLPILEAMACRTPVAATPAGAAPEILKKGGGILVQDFSSDSLAEAILEIVSLEDSSWRKLSEKARESVLGYTWDDAADLFEKALEKALRKGGGGK